MAITGVKLGGSGTFSATPVGGTLPPGVVPVWSTSDSLVTLTPAADGLSCQAAVASTDTNPSFPLTVQATLPDGTQPSGTATVPILPSEVTGFTIDQTA